MNEYAYIDILFGVILCALLLFILNIQVIYENSTKANINKSKQRF